MSGMGTSDYRARLYARYSQTHIAAKNPPTSAGIAYDAVWAGTNRKMLVDEFTNAVAANANLK